MTAVAVATGAKRGAVALEWLSNPVVIWGGSIIGIAAILYFFLPGFYSGAKAAAQKALTDAQAGFSGLVDNTQGNLASIFAANLPTSQDPGKRTASDSVSGLLVPTDRALSDDWDKLTGWL